MIKGVTYKDNGSIDIEIDNSELIGKRADTREELGGIMERGGDEERTLKSDLKRTGWKEARGATDVKHVCPVCGTRYWGRPNKAYCGTACKEVAKKRRSRKKKRDIRDFKPHRGKAGEVYYITTIKNKEVINFVPAFNADSRKRAKEYLEATNTKEAVDNIMEQIKEVVRK